MRHCVKMCPFPSQVPVSPTLKPNKSKLLRVEPGTGHFFGKDSPVICNTQQHFCISQTMFENHYAVESSPAFNSKTSGYLPVV